jgi:hypothetical protein
METQWTIALALIGIIINLIVLIVSSRTKASIAELKLYMHTTFVQKTDLRRASDYEAPDHTPPFPRRRAPR